MYFLIIGVGPLLCGVFFVIEATKLETDCVYPDAA